MTNIPTAEDIPELSDSFIAKQKMRTAIYEEAGDPETLLGTTADGVQFLFVRYFSLLDKISQASTIAALKTSLADEIAESTNMLADIASGATKMPYAVKYTSELELISDVSHSATKVAQAFLDNATP